MTKWKITWEINDTIEAETEEEAIASFKELVREGYYGPSTFDLDIEEVT